MSRTLWIAPALLLASGCADPSLSGVPDVSEPVDTAIDPGDAPTRDVSATDAIVGDSSATDVPTRDVSESDAPLSDVAAQDVPVGDVPVSLDATATDATATDATATDVFDAATRDAPSLDASGVDVIAPADAPADAPPADGGADAGAMGAGFSAASAWEVPRMALSDGFYAASLAEGTRWWTLADMNGDGRPDFVQTGDPARSGGYVFGAGTASPTWRVFFNTGSAFSTTATAWTLPNIGLGDGPYVANIASGVRWWSTLDINGDRRPDLVQTGDPARSGGYVFGAGTATNSWRVFFAR